MSKNAGKSVHANPLLVATGNCSVCATNTCATKTDIMHVTSTNCCYNMRRGQDCEEKKDCERQDEAQAWRFLHQLDLHAVNGGAEGQKVSFSLIDVGSAFTASDAFLFFSVFSACCEWYR